MIRNINRGKCNRNIIKILLLEIISTFVLYISHQYYNNQILLFFAILSLVPLLLTIIAFYLISLPEPDISNKLPRKIRKRRHRQKRRKNGSTFSHKPQ